MEETIEMSRRTFEHLYSEICVAVDRRISRYALWLLVWENGADPDDMTGEQAQNIVDHHLTDLLKEEGVSLEGRPRRRLARRILRFDPRYPTPEEWLTP
jgi:hypothetical protein